jgi:hypothetical protein
MEATLGLVIQTAIIHAIQSVRKYSERKTIRLAVDPHIRSTKNPIATVAALKASMIAT